MSSDNPSDWVPPDRPPTESPPVPSQPSPLGFPPPGPPAAPGGADGGSGLPVDPRSRRGKLIALGVTLAVLLTLGISAVLIAGGDDDPEPTEAAGRLDDEPTTTIDAEAEEELEPPPTSGPPAPPSELEQAVAELSEFVVQQRGMPFKRPVTVELLDGELFNQRLLEDFEEDIDELRKTERVLRALELIDDDDDLVEALKQFLGAAVLGFYDPETDELVVRGAALTPYVRSTLVHELVHAHDDQHFELHRPALEDADDESSIGFSGLIEGNAVRVEQAWTETLSREDRRRLEEEERRFGAGIDLSGVPDIIPGIIGFPYQFGPGLVEALLSAGGEERVNAAMADPPTTTEQIVNPEKYLRGEGAASVPRPRADGEVIDEGSYGYWVLALTLLEGTSADKMRRAIEGWAGDWLVAWDDGGRTCVRVAFAMDSQNDLDELEDAWHDWSGTHSDASVGQSGGLVTVTACG